MTLFEVGEKKKYTTIASAIEAASNGDEIIIESGVYKEFFEINKELYIHGSFSNRNEAKELSFKDIPIIYIKPSKTLEITAKCKLEGLLFTQKEKLKVDNLEELFHGKKKERWRNKINFQPMISISSDVTGNNCLFLFASSNGVTFVRGKSSFRKSVFSNCPENDIMILNNSTLEINDNSLIMNSFQGSGVYCSDESILEITNTKIINNKTGVYLLKKSISSIVNCQIINNSKFGVVLTEKTYCLLNNSQLSGLKNEGNSCICSNGMSKINIRNTIVESGWCGALVQNSARGYVLNSNFVDFYCGILNVESSFIFCVNDKFEKNYIGISCLDKSYTKIMNCHFGDGHCAITLKNKELICYNDLFENNDITIYLQEVSDISVKIEACRFSKNKRILDSDKIEEKRINFSNCIFDDDDQSKNMNIINTNAYVFQESKEIYKKFFEKEIEFVKSTLENTDVKKQFLTGDLSINIFKNSLNEIIRKFELQIFIRGDIVRFKNICKDLCPRNEEEREFIIELYENGLLEQLAEKKIEKSFYMMLTYIWEKYNGKTEINPLIDVLGQIFDVSMYSFNFINNLNELESSEKKDTIKYKANEKDSNSSKTPKLELKYERRVLSVFDGDILGRGAKYGEEWKNNILISRQHVLFKLIKNKWHILDLKSTNGTYINGKEIEPNNFYKIENNDIITLAGVVDYTVQIL